MRAEQQPGKALNGHNLTNSLNGLFSALITDRFGRLTKETEKYVNESSFLGNSAVYFFTFLIIFTFFFSRFYKKMELWSMYRAPWLIDAT